MTILDSSGKKFDYSKNCSFCGILKLVNDENLAKIDEYFMEVKHVS